MIAVSEKVKMALLRLGAFADAIDASRRYNRSDECGDWRLYGKAGWIYAEPEGYYLYCSPGSARAWGFVKKAMEFCEVTQDGDDEGMFRLDRLPTPAEGAIIRDKLGIRKARTMTEASKAGLVRARANSPVQGLRPPRSGKVA